MERLEKLPDKCSQSAKTESYKAKDLLMEQQKQGQLYSSQQPHIMLHSKRWLLWQDELCRLLQQLRQANRNAANIILTKLF
jgi:hypothetical protein